MIEQIAGERLAADPGERPERRRHVGACQGFFTRLPDRGDLSRQMKPDFGHQWRGGDCRVPADKEAWVHRGYPTTCPAMIAASNSQPTIRFDRNLPRQSVGRAIFTRAACHPSCNAAAANPTQNHSPSPAARPASAHSSTATAKKMKSHGRVRSPSAKAEDLTPIRASSSL